MPNRILLLVHYLACFRAGFVTTPLNYRYAPREIDHALEVSGAAPSWRTRNGPTTSRPPRAGGLLQIGVEGSLGTAPRSNSSSPTTRVRFRSRPHRGATRRRSSSRPAAPARRRASRTASIRSDGWWRARSTASSSPPPTPSSPVRRCRTSGRSCGRWRRCRSAPTWSWRAPSTPVRSCRCCAPTAPRSWP